VQIGGNVSEALSKPDLSVGFPRETRETDLAWYAVQTQYRHEQRISRDLSMKGFPTFLPLIRETHQWSDRKKVLEVPAFSGYVFVRHDASVSERVRVLKTPGVVRMLGDNHTPVPVADVEIESLRRAFESNLKCTRCSYLTVGTMVEVKRGLLTGVRGRLTRINSSLRLILSVSTVSQSIWVEVDPESVEPVAVYPPSLSHSRSLGGMAHAIKSADPLVIPRLA
jgi:transcription antitermination factor NusG